MRVSESLHLIKEMIQNADYSRAETLLNQLLLSGHKSATAYCLSGQIKQEQSSYKDAVEFYEKALDLDSLHKESLTFLSILYNDLGDYKKGEIYFQKAKMSLQALDKKETSKSDVYEKDLSQKHFKLGCLYMEQSLWNEAVIEFEKALEKHSQFEDALTKKAHCYKQMGKIEQAIRALEIFISQNEQIAVASRVVLGDFLCEKGLFQAGIKHWETAAQINSQHKEVQEKIKSYPSLPVSENLITE